MDKRFFDRPALGIGTIQHGKMIVAAVAPVYRVADAAHNRLAFLALAANLQQLHGQSSIRIGPQPLIATLQIFGNYSVRRVQNRLGAAIILLQLDDRTIGIIVLKIQNITKIRPAPTVNRVVYSYAFC